MSLTAGVASVDGYQCFVTVDLELIALMLMISLSYGYEEKKNYL